MYFNPQMHAWVCIQMVKNNEKCFKIIKKVLFSLKLLRSNQLLDVDQYLGVTPKPWKLSFLAYFYMSLTSASHAYDEISTFLIVFKCVYYFPPCEPMRKHAFAGRNTQQIGTSYQKMKNARTSNSNFFFVLSHLSFWTTNRLYCV